MSSDLDVYVGVALDLGADAQSYESERDLLYVLLDGDDDEDRYERLSEDGWDSYEKECFRIHLGLPEEPEFCPNYYDGTEGLKWPERDEVCRKNVRVWKATPEGQLYEQIQEKRREEVQRLGVTVRYAGGFESQLPVFCIEASLQTCEWRGVIRTFPEVTPEAERNLLEYARICKLDHPDHNLKVRVLAWGNYG